MIKGGYLYLASALFVLTLFILGSLSCSPNRYASIAKRDTLIVEKLIEVKKIVRDTVYTSKCIVEYINDTVDGKWKATKMLVENEIQKSSKKSDVAEDVYMVEQINSHTDSNSNSQKTNQWKWFVLGSVITFIGLFVLLIKR